MAVKIRNRCGRSSALQPAAVVISMANLTTTVPLISWSMPLPDEKMAQRLAKLQRDLETAKGLALAMTLPVALHSVAVCVPVSPASL